tara:strand:- start:1102 stop:1626 length:525 start_codon:yes stop_codon:yes gene_type:complete
MNIQQSQEEYRKEYVKAYQLANPEQVKESKAKWRDKNRQHTRDYAKSYYASHKEKYAVRYEAEKDTLAQKAKEYHNSDKGRKRHTISYWKGKRKIQHDDFSTLYDDYKNSSVCNKCDMPYGEKGDGTGTYKCIALKYGTKEVDGICCFRCMNREKSIAKNNAIKSTLNINVQNI